MIIFFCCAGVVGGLGCVTAATMDSINQKQRARTAKNYFHDTVFAIGQPDEKLTAEVGDDAIAFLGKKKTTY